MAEIIGETIRHLAARPVAFSVEDVASLAGLEGLESAVEESLREQCTKGTILCLEEKKDGSASASRILDRIDPVTGEVHSCEVEESTYSSVHYLGVRVAEKWWVNRTLRWATANVEYASHTQLASSMAIAFNCRRWEAPPPDMLAVGRRWAMVTDGCVPGTLVFPWATVLRVNPLFAEPFRLLFSSDLNELSIEDIGTAFDQVLDDLPAREATIVRARFHLDSDLPKTLEELGLLLGITRERVRQIETRVLRSEALKAPLWLRFVADFIQSGGSLLIQSQFSIGILRLLVKVWSFSSVEVIPLEIRLIATEYDVADYMGSVKKSYDLWDSDREQDFHSVDALPGFFTHADRIQLSEAEKQLRSGQVTKTAQRMLVHALRSLGRAAHFTEIAKECNRLFPEEERAIHNWHAALSLHSQPEREDSGIAWIGRKGMYGLQEHGYSRPDASLFDEVSRIVIETFERTQRPVSIEVVMTELSKKRRELSRQSVIMALSFHDNLLPASDGKYMPKENNSIRSDDSPHLEYDIGAAFQAFSFEEEES